MATVTGLTKARMLLIEAASVISGAVNAVGHLILITHGGAEIDAGLVKGPQGDRGVQGEIGPLGPQGLQGPPGQNVTGVISIFAGAVAPMGSLLCNGALVSRTTYSNLFSIIGTTYGVGDGTNTFGLPNLKGKTVVGVDASQTDFNTLGESGGEKTHLISVAEMPVHTHVQNAHQHNNRPDGNFHSWRWGPGSGVNVYAVGVQIAAGTPPQNELSTVQGGATGTLPTTPTNQNAGGGVAHNNLQPYISLNYIIYI